MIFLTILTLLHPWTSCYELYGPRRSAYKTHYHLVLRGAIMLHDKNCRWMPSRQQMPASWGTLWILFSGKSFNLFMIFCFVLWHTALSFFLADKLIQWSQFKISYLCEEIHEIGEPNGHLIFHVPTVEFQKNTCLLFLLAWTTLIILHVNFMYHYSKSIPFVKESTGLWVNFFSEATHPKGCPVTKV